MSATTLDLLAVKRYVPAGAGTIDITSTAEIDFATERLFTSATYYRFIRIQAHDGDLLVSIGSVGTHGVAPVSPPNAGGLRVFQGTYQVFQLRQDGTPSVRIFAAGATGHGSVQWGV